MIVEFVIHDRPAPAGSKKPVRYGKAPTDGSEDTRRWGVVDANRKAAPWKKLVAKAAKEAMAGQPMFEKDEPLRATFRFVRARPQNHYRTNGELKDWAVGLMPVGAPDALKLARGVEDAMQAVVYPNDSAICDELLTKEYGDGDRVEIKVEAM